ncbi:hypothetical protein GCM10007885_07140 [Methylobacterium gnaphalii]|nr:hypothetical protein GCM10007885_07140 [Methylobacterium gnaphalii]
MVGVELGGDEPQESEAFLTGKRCVTFEDQASQGHPGRLAAPRDQVLAKLQQIGCARCPGDIAPTEIDQLAPAIPDRLKEVTEE